MATHVRILGVLHIVFACIGVLVGLGLLALFGGLATLVTMQERGQDALIGATVLGGIGTFVFVLMLVLSIPGLIAGIGLLKFRGWARILTIILSGLELLNFPFGTALGIYGLWAMFQPETERLFGSPGTAPLPT